MRKLRIIVVLLIAFTTISYGASFTLVSANYPINLNGAKLAVTPLNYNGTTYLPLRSIAEATGVPITWNQAKKSVEITTVELEELKAACTMIIASDGETYEQGSGVYTDYDEVLTAYHAVDENRIFARTTIDQKDENKMSVVSSNSAIDIAALKPTIERKPVKIGDSDDVKIGDKVILISSPAGKTNTVEYGIVKNITHEIVLTAFSEAGSSGGALFNLNGELIGIIVARDAGLSECYVTKINTIRKTI